MTSPARAAVRLRPLEYVQLYGPPAKRCTGCNHNRKRPEEHDAGGRLDRQVLEDVARWAGYGRPGGDPWGENTRPSVPEIARRIGYSERSVQYSLRRLERGGYIEVDEERPGGTTKYRIRRPVEPVDELADVVNFSVHKQRRSRRRNTGPLHHSGATVAPNLVPLPEELPPVAPDEVLRNAVGADAPAQRGAPMAPRAGSPPSGTAPPSRIEVRAEPHRQDAGRQRVPEPDPTTRDDVAAVLRPALDDLGAAGWGDPVPASRIEHWTRDAARRLRSCPRCGAAPGEACRNRAGRLRKANHNERRIPR